MLHSRQTTGTFIALALAIVLAACGGPGQTAGPPGVSRDARPTPSAVNLDGTEWVLTSLDGHSPVEGWAITLDFPDENYLQGHAGCNYYGARYASDGNGFNLSEGRIDTTDFACDVPDSVMQQEAAYFEALRIAAVYGLIDDRLVFVNAAGETILAFTMQEEPSIDPALEDTEWVLTSLNGRSLLEGTTITLNFAAGFLEGFAGCNAYGGGRDSGKYTAADEGILAIPAVAITAQDCHEPEGVMQQEADYVEALHDAAAYRVTDNRLEIENGAGETTLVFRRKEELSMDPRDLLGTAWRLLSWNGDSLIEGSTITLAFHNEVQASGHAGCRGYVATYQASDDDIGFHWFAMTGPYEHCSEALMEQEGQYTTVLGWTTDYQLGEGQLEILTARGEVLVFEPLPEDANASLEGTAWTLTAFIEEKRVEGMPTPLLMPTDLLAETEIMATFEDSTVSGSAGCNSYRAAYAVDGSSLNVEAPAATEMACLSPAGVMEQEQRYLGFLRDVTAHRIHGNQLWLETGDGRALVLVQEIDR